MRDFKHFFCKRDPHPLAIQIQNQWGEFEFQGTVYHKNAEESDE